MSERDQALFEAALLLPETTRVALAKQLWESLSPELVAKLDDEWLAELETRDKEFDEGTADPIEWSVLRREVEPLS